MLGCINLSRLIMNLVTIICSSRSSSQYQMKMFHWIFIKCNKWIQESVKERMATLFQEYEWCQQNKESLGWNGNTEWYGWFWTQWSTDSKLIDNNCQGDSKGTYILHPCSTLNNQNLITNDWPTSIEDLNKDRLLAGFWPFGKNTFFAKQVWIELTEDVMKC